MERLLKNLGESHDLYVQSNTLLPADVIQNFSKMCIGIYELDPAHFFSARRLTRQGSLREKCPNTEFFLVRNFPHSD